METGNVTYNEALRTVVSPENYSQALGIFKVVGPEIALVLLVPFVWCLLYAGLIEEWDCSNYWWIAGTTAFVTLLMVAVFPYMLMLL